MLIIGTCLAIWISAIYSIYRNVSDNTEISRQIANANSLLGVFYGLQIILVLNFSSSLMNDARKAPEIIHKVMNQIQDEAMNKRVIID